MRERTNNVKAVNQQRRDFLKTCLRTGALAGLAVAVIPPFLRKNVPCAQANSCANCGQFGRCDLPQAVEHREIAVRRPR